MKKKTAATLGAATLVAGLGLVAAPAVAAPGYDSPYDIAIAKRLTLRAFYNLSYSSQASVCRSWDSRPVYVTRRLGRTAYRNTPDRVSLREAQKGVIYALVRVCD